MSQGNTDVSGQATAVPAKNRNRARPRRAPSGRCSTGSAASGAIGILIEAARGPVRFTELERIIEGISRRMLTLTLRNLERDGLLVRTVYPTVPPKVEYVATDMARELYETLLALTDWAERHREAIAAAREAYDRAHGRRGD